jgi:hypothetical protein
LKRLDEDEEGLNNDDFSIFDCIQQDGTVVDNSNTPTHPIKPIISRHKRCMLYQLQVGEHMVQATPFESPWYLMYIKCPMINVSKFHVQFHQRFHLPYAQFIQLNSDAKEKN